MASDNHESQGASPSEPTEVFQPMMGNILAGFIISGLLVAGAAAAIGFPLRAAYLADWNLPATAEKDLSWLTLGIMCLVGVCLTIGGVILGLYSRGLISHRVETSANGFRYHSRQASQDVPWTDIGLIRETILYERPPVLKGVAKRLLPKVASTSYTVITTSGEEYDFDGNSIKAIKRFGAILQEQAEHFSLEWETIEEHA